MGIGKIDGDRHNGHNGHIRQNRQKERDGHKRQAGRRKKRKDAITLKDPLRLMSVAGPLG